MIFKQSVALLPLVCLLASSASASVPKDRPSTHALQSKATKLRTAFFHLRREAMERWSEVAEGVSKASVATTATERAYQAGAEYLRASAAVAEYDAKAGGRLAKSRSERAAFRIKYAEEFEWKAKNPPRIDFASPLKEIEIESYRADYTPNGIVYGARMGMDNTVAEKLSRSDIEALGAVVIEAKMVEIVPGKPGVWIAQLPDAPEISTTGTTAEKAAYNLYQQARKEAVRAVKELSGVE